MHQFFVEPYQIQGKRVVIRGKDVNHIKNVLRMKPGEEISISNGEDGREYRCGIEEITEEEVICRLRFIKEDGLELPSRIYLFQGLPKADKMELIIQKAVELGAYEVIPVACRRSVVKLDGKKAAAKSARWQGIAEAAAKQSRRGIIPKVQNVMDFQEALCYSSKIKVKLIPYELAGEAGGTMERTREIISGIKPGDDAAVFIGPEGGFEEEEVAQAMEAGAEPITLGRRILRTETAGMTVLSIIMYHLEQ
ncbi:MAG: 16S rRNA (uracil(1498)-N(3))-methyltransferase [Clostridium sp.]|nr:16S rRNA (uracil(1498)-N(3))-methyltransferase [Clostridium sp.]